MIINKYKKKDTVSHLWFALAVFMLIFNSTPVKKYIRLQLYKHGAPVELNSGEHIGVCTHGDCTLLERHEISTHISYAIVQSTDLDIFFFLSAIVAGVAFLYFRKRRDGTNYPEIDTFKGDAVPLYLHVCRLQV